MNYCHCFYGILRSLVVGIAILILEALPYFIRGIIVIAFTRYFMDVKIILSSLTCFLQKFVSH